MPVVPPLPAPPVLPPSDGPPDQAAVAAYMQYLLTLSPQQVSMLATQLAPQTAHQIQPVRRASHYRAVFLITHDTGSNHLTLSFPHENIKGFGESKDTDRTCMSRFEM